MDFINQEASMGNALISLIIPVYNEEAVLADSFKRMRDVMDKTGHPYEMIYVDDGSRDATLTELERICAEEPRARALSFSRNFGHQLAVTAGMDAAKGDALVIIDADLQDPPEVINELIAVWEQGYDVVYGKRLKREGETVFKKFTAAVYYRLLSAMSDQVIPLDTGDFRLLDRKVADTMASMREHHRFLRGMSAWAGYKQAPVEYVRHERFAGTTKYSMKKMLKLASDGITGFSSRPITLWGGLGVGVCAVAGLGLLALIVLSACGVAVAGWLWATDGIVLLNGMMFIALGLQGMYMGRMYDELKGRPLYIVSKQLNF
jgi:dolichol-phosphate mannosyltransferase